MRKFVHKFCGFGETILVLFAQLHEMMVLFYDTITTFFTREGQRHISLPQITNQILFTGVDAIVIVGVIALSCGITIAVQATTNMPQIGASEYFGQVIVISIIRELGPFFTSLVVIGRSGAALAAYIGNMKVSREISALDIMGISFINFLGLPVLISMVISMVCLNVFFDIVAIVGGLLIAKFFVQVDFFVLFSEILNAILIRDIFLSLFKSSLFGAAIAIISCYYGLHVQNIRFVPRAVIRAVVISMVITIVINVLLTVGFYAI